MFERRNDSLRGGCNGRFTAAVQQQHQIPKGFDCRKPISRIVASSLLKICEKFTHLRSQNSTTINILPDVFYTFDHKIRR